MASFHLMTNPGVLSLRCPACGRMFLSLPQQAGNYVTCPHCAQSAAMTMFGTSQTPAAESLPMRRRVARQPDPMPTPAWAPPSQPQPQGYPGQSPFFAAGQFSQTPWPVAPEAPPPFTPAPHQQQPNAGFSPQALFGPAWSQVTQSQPQVQPQPQYPQQATSPFSAAPATQAPVSMFGLAEQHWAPEPAPLYQPAPMYQPTASQVPLDFAAMRESPQMDEASMETWQPPRQRSSVLPALFFLLLVIGACVWVLREDLFPPLVVEIPAGPATPQPVTPSPAPPEPASPTTQPKTPTPVPTLALEPSPAPTTSEPEPEIRRAEVPKPTINLVAASASGQKLFLDLLEATTPEARARLIDQPEEHAADLEEFFAAGKPELMSFKPTNATPLKLPGHELLPLFQVTTQANKHGAMLLLVPQKDGSFLLDWPLFAETHERRLAVFLEKKPSEPAWFQVGMRRSHGLELPDAVRSIQHAFTLQGSADASVSCNAFCQKDTPIGRYLGRDTEWTTVYIARLLLQHRKLADGTPAVMILDCEGAATAQ